mmetsp:Transcript_3809/g.5775  ORF Transcript_3809/g.5775 Transcript_3809/m.5775 type:complete len:227 (+) Transcript_3809:27-707(+)
MGNRPSATSDVQAYLDGYPDDHDNDEKKNDNVLFYRNELLCRPDQMSIDDIHKQWWGCYELLEAKHGYIQWLFPIREDGLNYQAQRLRKHEITSFSESPEMISRLVKSYQMMLHFYGMQVDISTGVVSRHEENWKERFLHLNSSFHNYLRITRILKCLGEMGLERLKAPFVSFVLTQIFEHGQLRGAARSALEFWLPVIRSDTEKADLFAYVEQFNSPNSSGQRQA